MNRVSLFGWFPILISPSQRQTDELQDAVERMTEIAVNEMSVRHCEERQIFESGWESRMVNMHETHRIHFRDWLLGMAEIVETAPKDQPLFPEEDYPPDASEASTGSDHQEHSVFRLEESFTIQLGAQMKQSHNLRLISADVLDLCRLPATQNRHDPQRLQMALSLYSTNQSGLVLLVDDRLSSYTGMEREFLRICRRSAELHFPRADLQLEHARHIFATSASNWRQQVCIFSKPIRSYPADRFLFVDLSSTFTHERPDQSEQNATPGRSIRQPPLEPVSGVVR